MYLRQLFRILFRTLNHQYDYVFDWTILKQKAASSAVVTGSQQTVATAGRFYVLLDLRNLTSTLTTYIFGTKHDIHNWANALTNTRGLLYRLKLSLTLVYKWLLTQPPFLPTVRKFCILFHCQASQTEISKCNSTKLCQTIDGTSR